MGKNFPDEGRANALPSSRFTHEQMPQSPDARTFHIRVDGEATYAHKFFTFKCAEEYFARLCKPRFTAVPLRGHTVEKSHMFSASLPDKRIKARNG